MNGREEGLIGGILAYQGECIESILTRVQAGDFQVSLNRSIFTAIETLQRQGSPINFLNVAEHLAEKKGKLDPETREYIFDLAQSGKEFGSKHQLHFAKLIRDFADKERLSESAAKISDLAKQHSAISYDDLVGQLDTELVRMRAASASKGRSNSHDAKMMVHATLGKIKRIIGDGNVVTAGVSYGVESVDKFSMGMHPADMIVVAGRPGMGKTTFSMGAVIKNAIFERKPVLVFSLEMPADQLFERLVSNLSGVPFRRFREGGFSQSEIEAINQTIIDYDIYNAPLIIYDEPGIKFSKMRNIALDYARQYDLALVMVDYLQLMSGENPKASRTEQIGEISRNIKQLAKELAVPVMLLSQLNRNVEQRPNKRPVNSDLRESGGIEQDADTIVFLYRDEYYNPATKDKGITEIIFSKCRHSEPGTVKVGFSGKVNRFYDLSRPPTESGHKPLIDTDVRAPGAANHVQKPAAPDFEVDDLPWADEAMDTLAFGDQDINEGGVKEGKHEASLDMPDVGYTSPDNDELATLDLRNF